MDLELIKSQLRKEFREKRNSLSKEEAANLSYEICSNFINFYNNLPKNNYISLYKSFGNEVNTITIHEFFIKNKIDFCYPKIMDKNLPLKFFKFFEKSSFKKSNFFNNLAEIDSNIEVKPTILLVPLLAFDNNLNRLGMGGGFYDKTISKLAHRSNIITIGLAYNIQKNSSLLPYNLFDQKLNFIITETKIYTQKSL